MGILKNDTMTLPHIVSFDRRTYSGFSLYSSLVRSTHSLFCLLLCYCLFFAFASLRVFFACFAVLLCLLAEPLRPPLTRKEASKLASQNQACTPARRLIATKKAIKETNERGRKEENKHPRKKQPGARAV